MTSALPATVAGDVAWLPRLIPALGKVFDIFIISCLGLVKPQSQYKGVERELVEGKKG